MQGIDRDECEKRASVCKKISYENTYFEIMFPGKNYETFIHEQEQVMWKQKYPNIPYLLKDMEEFERRGMYKEEEMRMKKAVNIETLWNRKFPLLQNPLKCYKEFKSDPPKSPEQLLLMDITKKINKIKK